MVADSFKLGVKNALSNSIIMDENGLTITAPNNNSINISGDKITFRYNNTDVAYISGTSMTISNLDTTTVTIGSNLVITTGTKNNENAVFFSVRS